MGAASSAACTQLLSSVRNYVCSPQAFGTEEASWMSLSRAPMKCIRLSLTLGELQGMRAAFLTARMHARGLHRLRALGIRQF